MKSLTRASVIALVVLTALTTAAYALTIDMVTVGDPGNDPDTGGAPASSGSVGYTYQIGKTTVTNTQYAEFLTAVDDGTNPLGLYHGSMGITHLGSGNYAAVAGREQEPVIYVSWYDPIRFANWMTSGDTESGTYTITGGGPDSGTVTLPTAAQRAGWAAAGPYHVMVPTVDEWYKAAYYKGGGTSAGYYLYPTSSDNPPTEEGPPGGAADPNGSANYNSATGGLTDVLAYSGKPTTSPYGLYDLGGNVFEWCEDPLGSGHANRGGNWASPASQLASTFHAWNWDTQYLDRQGIRVVSVVPEPASAVLLLLGLPFVMWRKR